MTSFQIYLLLMLDSVPGMILTGCVFTAVGLVVSCAISSWSLDEDQKKARRNGEYLKKEDVDSRLCAKSWPIYLIGIAVVLGLATNLVPTTKQAAAILVLPTIINNEKVQQLPEQVIDLGMEWLEDLKEKENK